MRKIICALIGIHIAITAFCQTDSAWLDMADKAYENNKRDSAKIYYLKAAEHNNAEAHFQLFYKFVLPEKEQRYHLIAAAKQGHAKATEYMIELLFTRANSLRGANPKLAYETFKAAKKANPSIDLFENYGEILVIKECIEADPFDAAAFVKKYHINEDSLGDYGIWELASEASRGGRFGKPNNRLVLQLVCRGGLVPAEINDAVDDAYTNWKNDSIKEFNLCDHITSGFGMGYCSRKMVADADKENAHELDSITPLLKNKAGAFLKETFDLAGSFIDKKARTEEGAGGTGREAWVNYSIIAQTDSFIKLVEMINSDSLPQPFTGDISSGKQLDSIYQLVLKGFIKAPVESWNFYMTDSDEIAAQQLWIPYCNASAKLFATIMPAISITRWTNWLEEIRIAQLQEVLEMQAQALSH